MSVDGKRRGLFIAFEGSDGSGKSTQAQLLAQRLRLADLDVLLTREPGGTDLGERLRTLMLQERSLPDLRPRVQTLLMLAARAQHVAERIRPWLRSGGVVICDRFTGSTLAYQGAGFGLQSTALEEFNRFATFGVRPDATVLLDLDVQLGLARSFNQRGGDWEKAGGINAQQVDFHKRVRESYLDQAKKKGWTVLDGTLPRDELHFSVCNVVAHKIAARSLRKAPAVQSPLPLDARTEALALEELKEAVVNAGMLWPATTLQPALPLEEWGEAPVLEAWNEALAKAGMLQLSLEVPSETLPEPPPHKAGSS